MVTVSELGEAVRQALAELTEFQQVLAKEAEESNAPQDAATEGGRTKANGEALEEIHRMLSLVQKQVQEQSDQLEQLSSLEMGQTCDGVVQSLTSCFKEGGPSADEAKSLCSALQALNADPSLAALPACMPAKPLRQYEASEVLDTPETTEAVLGQVIRWEGLCGGKTKKSAAELLSRPPPKFILDIALAVKAATGFPPDLESDWPEARDDRLARFRSIADAVRSVLGVAPDFDPTDVLRGKEVSKTLRLIQLLAVAAAKRMPPMENKGPVSGNRRGIARPRELPAMLDAMARCLQAAKAQVDAKREAIKAAVQGEQSLEEKIDALERQLQEESIFRSHQEEALADAERQLEESRAEVKKITNECELTKAAEQASPEQLELEKQVGLLAPAPADLPDDEVPRMLAQQIEEVNKEIQKDECDTSELEAKQQELEAAVKEAEAHARQLEAEVAREQKRCETEKELMGQSPEEQKLILQAHEQKLRTRAEMLEAQITQMQAEAEERKANNLRLEQEKCELQAKAEDAHLQMQIVQEERDAMREAMEQLWNEKSAVDEELQNHMQGYINLTERYTTQQDETCELETLVEQRRQEVAGLQKNGFHMFSGGAMLAVA